MKSSCKASTMARLLGLLAFLLLFSKSVMTAPTCPTTIKEVSPCIAFLKGVQSGPSGTCCSGVKGVFSSLNGQAGRTAVCLCLQQALSKIGPYDPNRLPTLGKICGLPNGGVPPIDAKTDCSKAWMYHVG